MDAKSPIRIPEVTIKPKAAKPLEPILKPILKPKAAESSKELLLNKIKEKSVTATKSVAVTDIGSEQMLKAELEKLKTELDATKSRAERAERDKSDILLRRLASMDTGWNGFV